MSVGFDAILFHTSPFPLQTSKRLQEIVNPVLAAERHSQAQLVEALESHPELLRLAELETSRVLPKNGNATRHRFRPGQSERNVFRNVPLEMPESVESRL